MNFNCHVLDTPSTPQEIRSLFSKNQQLAKVKKQSQLQKLALYEQKLSKLNKLLIQTQNQQANSQEKTAIQKKIRQLEQKKLQAIKKIQIVECIEKEIIAYTGSEDSIEQNNQQQQNLSQQIQRQANKCFSKKRSTLSSIQKVQSFEKSNILQNSKMQLKVLHEINQFNYDENKNNENINLQKAQKKYIESLEKLKKEFQILEQQCQSNKNTINKFQRQKQQLQRVNTSLSETQQQLQKKINKSLEYISNFVKQLRNYNYYKESSFSFDNSQDNLPLWKYDQISQQSQRVAEQFLKQLTDFLDNSKHNIQNMNNQYCNIHQSLLKIRQQYNGQQAHFKKLQQSFQNKESALFKMEEKWKCLSQQVNKYTQQKINLQRQIQQADDLLVVKKCNFDELDRKCETLKKKKSNLKEKCEKNEHVVQQQQRKIQLLANKTKAEHERLMQIDLQIKKLLHQRQSMISQLNQLEQKIDINKKQQNQIKQDSKQIRKISKETSQRLKVVLGELKDVNQQLKQSKVELQKIQEKIESRTMEVQQLLIRNKSVKEQNKFLQQKVQILKKQQIELESNVDKNQHNFELLIKDLKEITAMKAQIDSQIQQSNKRRHEISEEVEEAEAIFSQFEQNISILSKQQNRLIQNIDQLKKEQQHLKKNVYQLQEQQQRMSNDNQQLQQIISKMKNQLSDLSEQQQNLSSRIQQLKQLEITITLENYLLSQSQKQGQPQLQEFWRKKASEIVQAMSQLQKIKQK